uniref:Uncharacterized protein n=1 Tax=Tetranychus urticae TaxID=32264 RepID=T1KCI1_TETUR
MQKRGPRIFFMKRLSEVKTHRKNSFRAHMYQPSKRKIIMRKLLNSKSILATCY